MGKLKHIAKLILVIYLAGAIIACADNDIGEIGNIPPTIDLSVTPVKKPVDIVILTDYTGSNLSALNTQINALKANFAAVNVDPVFHIVSNMKNIGTQNDTMYKFARYGRFKTTYSSYERYKNYGLEEEHSPYTVEYTELWEEIEWPISQHEYLPVRNPQNVSFTKSALIKDEYNDGATDYHYYEVIIKCTNDVKIRSEVFEQEIWYKSVNSTPVERKYGSITSQQAIVDKTWTPGTKVRDVTFDVFSLDFDSLNAIPLRSGSDRHMIFLSDAATKDYSKSQGNYFCFGDMTDSFNAYIKNNNFRLYGVVPDKTRYSTLHPDLVTDIEPYGEYTLFHMENGDLMRLGNKTVAGILGSGAKMYPEPGSPEDIADMTGVKEVIDGFSDDTRYYLMNNGKLKKKEKNKEPVYVSGISDVKQVIVDNGGGLEYITNAGKAYVYNPDTGAVTTYQDYNSGILKMIKLSTGHIIYLKSGGAAYGILNYYDGSDWESVDLTKIQIVYEADDVEKVKNLSGIKDIKEFEINKNGRIEGIIIQYTNNSVELFMGYGNNYRRDKRDEHYDYPVFSQADAGYECKESGVSSISTTDYGVVLHKADGTTRIITADIVSGRAQQPKASKAIPLNNITWVPLDKYQGHENFHTRSFYKDSAGRYYMLVSSDSVPVPAGAKIVDLGTDVRKIAYSYTYNAMYIYYGNGDLRKLSYSSGTITDSVVYTGVKGIYTVIGFQTYILFDNGTVLGEGESSNGQLGVVKSSSSYRNPFSNPLTFDTTKTYYSILDIFKEITESEFFDTGQYTAALNSIYRGYENNSGVGSTYVLLGEDMEYKVTYDDYESDPEYSRKWRISHDPDYFDNSMGLSVYHNPSGFAATPPVKLDKVGRYVINLKARDNPKDDNRFDNYRLWSLGNQNLSVYVHRKPVALQRITVDDNGNGTFTIAAFDAGSYDMDHNVSRADKGIVAREWRWRESTDLNWHYEQISKHDCSPEREYTLQLRVQDAEGVWSGYNTIEIADDPPVALFDIEKNPILAAEKLLVRDESFPRSFFPIDRWHWIVKKYSDDGTLSEDDIQNMQFETSNNGTEDMEGYDANVKTNYENTGEGKYRIYLRVRDSRGLWSDFYAQDITVQESFKISNFRVVKIRDLHLESYYYNPVAGEYDDKPMGVSEMAIDYRNFNSMVDGLTKGYAFEFEIDTMNFNEDSDTIEILPRFYTCDNFTRDEEERGLYWENSRHEIMKAGEGGHAAWAAVELTSMDRQLKEGSQATWRGSYLIPGTAWAVPAGTSPANAKASRINRDIIVNFDIKGYRDGELKFDYNLRQWPAERGEGKLPYEIGDVIRYSHNKNNLDDIDVILNRP